MWSDTTSFSDLRQHIAFVPHIVASKGDVRKDLKGAPLNSRFGRNYVSFEEFELNDACELQPCVVASSEYARLIRAKDVEATLWTAVFRQEFAYQGAIGESAIARASAIGVRLFIEDYTRPDDGSVPKNIWLNE